MIARNDLRELREVIEQARRILNTAIIPDGRAHQAKELLMQAVSMTDTLIARPTIADAMKSRKSRR